MKYLLIPVVLLILASVPMSATAERVEFDLIPGALSANDMSPDGRFIVGSSDLDGNGTADGTYLLDRTLDTMTPLPALGLTAVAVSDGGQVVVGDIPDPSGVGSNVAARWTESTGWQSLGHLPNAGACPSRSDSYEVSADGSTVVGLSWDGCSGRGFIWTESTEMLQLQNLANGGNRASVISSDGKVIGGFAQSNSRTPAVWRSDTTGELLDPPTGARGGEIFGIRDDGSVLLGDFAYPGLFTFQATKWTATPEGGWTSELIGAGSLIPGWAGTPMDIADDDTIVGFDRILGNRRAWIQPQGEGPLMDLKFYFESHGAEVPPGLVLEVPQAISADGHFIIGHGFFGAWMATILSDCDFDGDLHCDIDDIDALVTQIVAGTDDPLFDLSGDGVVDLIDRDEWLTQAGAQNLPSGNAYLLGDANLDSVVDGSDFLEWNENKFLSTGKWSQGDFNADGVTDGLDFLIWNGKKFTSSGDALVVPEPSLPRIAIIISMLALRPRRRRQHQPGATRPHL